MPDLLLLAADLVALTLLTFGSFVRRHRRRDMVLAYVGLNVGVFAVTSVLAGATVTLGLGLGLFGILSIIRLRSSELSQEEVAYYFASLAVGLVLGLSPEPRWLGPTLAALVVGAVMLADHPSLLARSRRQLVTLDGVLTDEAALAARLEDLLGGTVRRAVVLQTDLVRDSMLVDVRYEVVPPGRRREERRLGAVGLAAREAGRTVPAPGAVALAGTGPDGGAVASGGHR